MFVIMETEVYSYFNISEMSEILADLYKKNGEKALFLVPTSLDKENLMRIIAADSSYFGSRPQIWTIGELYRETSKLCDTQRRVIDPPDHNLILNYLVGRFLDEMASSGIELPAGIKHKGFIGVLGDNIKELLAEDVTPEHLKATLFGDGEYNKADAEALLLRLYNDYLEYLEDNCLADAGQIPSLMKSILFFDKISDFVKKRLFVFVGFLSFTGSQIKLVRALTEMSGAVLIQPETGLDDFYDGIVQLKKEYRRRPEWKIGILELNANNVNIQFSSIAREIALWPHGEGNFSKLGEIKDYGDAAVLVSQKRLPLLLTALEKYKIPYNTQVRGTVAETPLGELPKRIWRAYVSGWKTNDTLSLLKTPLLGCDESWCEKITSLFPEGEISWKKSLEGEALALFEKFNVLCRGFAVGGSPGYVLSLWRDFICSFDLAARASQRIGDELSLDDSVKDISSAVNELNKKIEALEDLKREIGEAAKISLKGSEAVSYVTTWSRTATLPIQLPQNSSVTIYCGIPPVLTFHRYWIMADIDYNTWPGKLRESPLLGSDSKRKINSCSAEEKEQPYLPDIHDERKQKEAIFRRLIATAKDGVVLSRSMVDANKRPIGPSQFVLPLFAKHQYVELNRLGSVEYPLAKSIPNREEYIFPEAEVALSEPKIERGSIPRVGVCVPQDEIPVVNLSSLDDWIKCPFRYWCRYILRVDTNSSELFDRRKAGKFMHKVWEHSFDEASVSGNSLFNVVNKNYDEIEKSYYRELSSDPRLLRYAKKLRKQLLDLAEHQDEIEFRLKGRRTKMEMEYKFAEYICEGVKFQGRADRIDFYGESAVILDYKSGKSEYHKDELQLAAYAVLLKDTENINPGGYGWFGHGDNRLFGFFEPSYTDIYFTRRKNNQKSLASLLDYARRAMSEMAFGIKKGEFPANYNAGGGNECQRCPYYTICRKREVGYWDLDDNELDGGAFDE